MVKKHLLSLMMLVLIGTACAQDLIVLSNGNVIKAKVTEIDDGKIKYKDFANLQGPVLTIFTADVLSITYENGHVQSFSKSAPATSSQKSQVTDRARGGNFDFSSLTDDERAAQIDYFLAKNKKYLPKDRWDIDRLRSKLMEQNDSRLKSILSMSSSDFKNPTTALILSLLVGSLGIDRFYTGDIGWGVAKLLTAGLFGIGTIVDWFLIMGDTRDKNYEEIMNLCY